MQTEKGGNRRQEISSFWDILKLCGCYVWGYMKMVHKSYAIQFVTDIDVNFNRLLRLVDNITTHIF